MMRRLTLLWAWWPLLLISGCASEPPAPQSPAQVLAPRPKAQRVWILAVEGGVIPSVLQEALPPRALTFPETKLALPLRLPELLYSVLATGKAPRRASVQDRMRRDKTGRVLKVKRPPDATPPAQIDLTVVKPEETLGPTAEKIREEISKGTAIWLVGVPRSPVGDFCGPAPASWGQAAGKRIAAACVGETIRIWLHAKSREALAADTNHFRKLPDVEEIFVRYPLGESQQWVRNYRAKESPLPPSGKLRTDPIQEAMNSIAASPAPDVYVWPKADNRAPTAAFPLILWSPNLKENTLSAVPEAVRWVDVAAMSLRLMEKPVPETLDGNAQALEPFLTPKF